MNKDQTIRVLSIGLGLLIAILLIWFVVQVLQQRAGRAEGLVTSVQCEESGESSYEVAFTLGRNTRADIQYGTSPTEITSIAPSTCELNQCKALIAPVNTNETVYFRIVVGGQKIGNGSVNDSEAIPFVCSPTGTSASTSGESGAKPTATPSERPTPFPTADVREEIRQKYSKWTSECLKEYTAVDCAAALPRSTSSESK